MNLKILVFISLLYSSQAFSYNFAGIANQILYTFETNKIRSNFGRELYAEIAKITNDFTENLTFEALEKYVDRSYLDYMSTEMIKNNSNTYVALIWPVTVGHDQTITRIFNKYCNIISSKRILLNDQGAKNFLAQIPSKASHPQGVDLWFQKPYSNYNPMRVYLLECKKNNTDYNQMKGYLTKIFNNNIAYIEQFERLYGKRAVENLYVTTKCKREIRETVKLGYAMHINDTHEETIHLGNIVFNENSIKCLKFSDSSKVKLLKRYNEYIPLLIEKLGNNIDKIVVYNSAVLSAYGLRDCGDIDFLHDPRISIPRNLHPQLSNQNQFFKRNYVILEDKEGKHYILEDIPHAFANVNLDASNLFKLKISIDELLYNPTYNFYFHGIKYATLEFMHYFKKKRGRAKDLQDVKLIEDHFLGRYN